MIDQIQYERIGTGLWTARLRIRGWTIQGAGKTVQEAESAMWEQYRKTFNT
jgi:hypothetical protein